MKNKEIMESLVEIDTMELKMNTFSRFIGKSGFILISAYENGDINKQKALKKRFPDIDKISDICRNKIKDGLCRAVCGSYLMGMSPVEIEKECKNIGIWKY